MAQTTRIVAVTAAAATVGLLGTALAGCSASVKVGSSGPPTISAADLQKKLTDQFTANKAVPQSVSCSDDLIGTVGKKATCEVVFSDTNAVQAVVSVTSVDGTTVNYDIAPALSREQLQKAVAGMASASTATCDSGVAGAVGETATCEVTVNGVASKRRVSVDGVSGLKLDLTVTVIASKQQVQDLLMRKLAAEGQQAEAVECVADVVAKIGMAVECTVLNGGQSRPVVVTVASVDGDALELDYSAKP